MSANLDPTTSSSLDSMSTLLAEGFPAVQRYPDDQAASEDDVRKRAKAMGLGLAAAVLRRDVEAFDAFMAELAALNEFGEGLRMAIGHLADVANDGLIGRVAVGQLIEVNPADLQDAGVRERLELWDKTSPGDSPGVDSSRRWEHALDIVALALTGRATGMAAPYGAALGKFGAATAGQQRDVLLMLAVVVAQRLDKFATWQGQGFDCLDDWREAHPVPAVEQLGLS